MTEPRTLYLDVPAHVRVCVFTLLAALAPSGAEEPLRGTPLPAISLRDVHLGTPEIDLGILNGYGDAPVRDQDFFARARPLFETKEESISFDHPRLLKLATGQDRFLLGGPMLGDLTSNSVRIWLRPAINERIDVLIFEEPGQQVARVQGKQNQAGLSQHRVVQDLQPDTAYRYEVVIPSGRVLAEGRFRTAPPENAAGTFRIAFGGDFHKVGLHHPDLFQSILQRGPNLMLLVGDSAADDRRENMNLHRADYLLRDVSVPWRDFAANMPVYAIWDDHDYFDDDLSGLQEGKFTEADRAALRAVWRDNWVNPPSPEGHDGIHFRTRVGPVDIFMLDTRSCRDHAKRGQYGSFLGLQQQEWLLEGLRDSDAPFKLIASGTMWSDYVSNGKDSWATWDTEALEEILHLMETENIGGVVLLSGDRHGARGFRIPRESGKAFIELGIGSLGGIHGPPGIIEGCEEQIFGYDGEGFVAFGELDVVTSGTPHVIFRLIGDKGQVLEEHRLSASP